MIVGAKYDYLQTSSRRNGGSVVNYVTSFGLV